MALHCPATILLVEEGDAVLEIGSAAGPYGPWGGGVDVVAELQALADLHRGERVLVCVGTGGVADVLGALGRVAPSGSTRVRLDVGDDGWVVLPWDGAGDA
ncbi:hypothetical protein [Oryzobacter telluris]|uniref:hypothetical protein n=1 Tax=Oryzobacter telluris TaxID=3149179 RepID=UPI00370D38EE